MQNVNKKEVYLNFASKIRYLRKKAGLSQRELCEKIGKSQSFINSIESASGSVSLHNVMMFCEFFGVTLSFFEPNKESKINQPTASDVKNIAKEISLLKENLKLINENSRKISSHDDTIKSIMTDMKEMQRQLLAFAEKERK